jgi:hypothetical protein
METDAAVPLQDAVLEQLNEQPARPRDHRSVMPTLDPCDVPVASDERVKSHITRLVDQLEADGLPSRELDLLSLALTKRTAAESH